MRKFSVVTGLLILVGALWTVAYAIADEGIEFDPAIEAYLKDEFNTTDLSTKFALSVEELDLSGLNLTSAKGIEHFKNLKKLNISHNILTDGSFLKGLKQLENLNASFNQFESVELSSSSLTKLNLEGN